MIVRAGLAVKVDGAMPKEHFIMADVTTNDSAIIRSLNDFTVALRDGQQFFLWFLRLQFLWIVEV